MSIRIRLLLSYLAMLLVPLALLFVAVLIIGAIILGNVRSVFTLDTQQKNPIAAIMDEEAAIAADIGNRAADNPDSLLEEARMQAYSERLDKLNMGLIVRIGDDVWFESPNLQDTGVADRLPAFGVRQEPLEGHSMNENWNWLLDRHFDAVFSDGTQGSYFMLFNIDFLSWSISRFVKSLLIALVVILVVVNGTLTYLVSRKIIRPLRSLKRAAGEIKEGDLAQPIRPESRDEIGELAVAFEEMRVKLKETIDRQLQLEENRKQLISNISHDLKTPVTAIKGYVEGILDGVTDSPEKLDRYVRTIHSKTVQMDRMIDELFLFSKLDAKGLPFHYEEVDLDAFLRDCTEELQLDAEKNGVKLVYEPAALQQPAMVAADREKLKRVMVNIIENSVKYSDKADSRIWISLAEEDQVYRVVVKDNGQGISPEALPFIFDRFYRADPARNTDTGGSGLGLAIARHIVEEHGGWIRAASEPGAGTVMMIALQKRGHKGEQG